MTTIPITNLSPTTDPPFDRSIRAVVTLSWPFSSSTRQCALLLADPDFRLRHRRGQVRVRFTGASAEAIAKAHIGIGDEVVLSLDGATWEQDPEATRTPGKSVEGELLFKRRVLLNIVRADGDVRVFVDAPVSPPRVLEDDVAIATPLPRAVQNLRSSLDGTSDVLPGYIYSSPAFRKRVRLSGGTVVDSAYDPFAGHGTDMELLERQNWLSYGSSVEWRYAERTPSPEKEAYEQDVVDVEEEVAAEIAQTPSEPKLSATQMSAPPLPPIGTILKQSATDSSVEDVTGRDQSARPSTPHLRPIESSTLPLPSPFPVASHSVQSGQMSLSRAILTGHQDDRSQHDIVRGEDADEQSWKAEDLPPAHDLPIGETSPPTLQIATPAKASDDIGSTSHNRVFGSMEMEVQSPQTPLAHAMDVGILSLDGTTSTSPSVRITPRSEKEKIMTQTYRSLFGFKSSPEAPAQFTHEEPATPTPMSAPIRLDRNSLNDAVSSFSRSSQVSASVPPVISSPAIEKPAMDQDSLRQLESASQPSRIPPSHVEVVEIGSSSDEEEEGEEHGGKEHHDSPALSLLLPTRDVPKLEAVGSVPEVSDEIPFPQVVPETQVMIHPTEAPAPQSFEPGQNLPPEYAVSPTILDLESPSLLATSEIVPGDVAFAAPHDILPDEDQLNTRVNTQPQFPDSEEPLLLPTDTAAEASLYPSLPLSPSNSQSLADMIWQAAADRLLPDTIASVLPPTPQLTQDASFTQLQGPAQSQAPVIVEEDLEQASAQQSEKMEESQTPIKRTRARKSSSARTSIVPDVISDWFAPRRSTGVEDEGPEHNEIHDRAEGTKLKPIKGAGHKEHTQPVNGLSTSLSYFTPLSRVEELLNPSSQQIHGANIVDVFAIVADQTSEAVKAKTGPQDYYSIFKIYDASLLARASVRVEVYRPWKAKLPVASVGDVVLLRAFTVKSRNRKPYLLSTDTSAWCVWRYTETKAAVEDENKPIWARRGERASGSVREEMKGPPLELGDEERAHATRLHEWWQTLQDEGDKYHEDNATGMADSVAQPVAAKF